MIHHLKTLPEHFGHLRDETKTFELRKDDRGFQVGDHLVLKEWSPQVEYTGRTEHRTVSYILRGPSPYGLAEGFCILSFEREP